MSLECFEKLENEINENFGNDKNFLFCDFLREDQKNEEGIVEVEAERVYEAINDIEKLRSRCEDLLEEYN